MATLIGCTRTILRCHGVFQRTLALRSARQSTMASVELTLDVKRRIEEVRQRALLGGGEQRIQVQHKKVGFNFFANFCIFCIIRSS